MGRVSAISGNGERRPAEAPSEAERREHERREHDARAPQRDPWSPSSSRDLLAAVAVIAVLFAILVVYTHDVPSAPRRPSADPVPWAQASPPRAAPPVDWPSLPVIQLPELGAALASAVDARVTRSRVAIARCLADEPGTTADAPPDPEAAAVVLRLVPRSAALHVDGVEASGPGTPPRLLACVRHVLDGDIIPAQGVVPGRRYRLQVSLR